jgi:hypothetical protein
VVEVHRYRRRIIANIRQNKDPRAAGVHKQDPLPSQDLDFRRLPKA